MNPNKIIIELPKSDGFHTTDDRHTAEIAQRRIRSYLNDPGGIPGCTVQIASEGVLPLVEAYKALLNIHMDTLLVHGPQVAQGVALAVKTVHDLLPPEYKNTVAVRVIKEIP